MMTATTSTQGASTRPSLDRRLAFMGLGMCFGLVMGLLLWVFDFFTGHQHHVVLITLGLMFVEGGIGFVIASGDRTKFDDVMTFIIAFFIVP
jgi:ribose/xylose/arabinose/galactoside ABC-type transport system permease subunit